MRLRAEFPHAGSVDHIDRCYSTKGPSRKGPRGQQVCFLPKGPLALNMLIEMQFSERAMLYSRFPNKFNLEHALVFVFLAKPAGGAAHLCIQAGKGRVSG